MFPSVTTETERSSQYHLQSFLHTPRFGIYVVTIGDPRPCPRELRKRKGKSKTRSRTLSVLEGVQDFGSHRGSVHSETPSTSPEADMAGLSEVPFAKSLAQSWHREKSWDHCASHPLPGVVDPQLLQRTHLVQIWNGRAEMPQKSFISVSVLI